MSTEENKELTHSADDAVPGKQVTVTGIEINRSANGKFVES